MIQPRKWSVPLGSGADVQDLPDDDLRYASFSKIFPQITQVPLPAGGVAPRRIDFNSLFKLLADNIYFYQNGGVFEYSDTADYERGALVRYNDNIYLCVQDNSALNVHNPEEMDYWLRVALNNELADYLPLVGGNVTGNLTVKNKNVVRTVNDIEADVNGNVVIESGTSLIPNQIIISPVPLTDANLHLLDGALLSGSGTYADYVTMMSELYTADPTANIWTDEATWQASVTNTGSCGKFVYDSVNNTLRLPKYDARYLKSTLSASDLGDLVNAQAPNITGDTGAGFCVAGGSGVSSGALSTKSEYIYQPSTGGGSSQSIQLNASDSNPIYSDSATTIDTDAVKVYYYIVLGTVSKTQIQIDIDNVMADLALKAEKDFSNVTAPVQAFKDMSVDWGLPDLSSPVTLNPNQVYQADSNILVVVRVSFVNGYTGIITNKTNNFPASPSDSSTTAINLACVGGNYSCSQAFLDNTISAIIRKGDYYKIWSTSWTTIDIVYYPLGAN